MDLLVQGTIGRNDDTLREVAECQDFRGKGAGEFSERESKHRGGLSGITRSS